MLLLVCYVLGVGKITGAYTPFHSHHGEAVVHSAEQEQDPCHRVIYHGDQKHGCDHRTHLTQEHRCHLCHVAFQSFQLVPPTLSIPLPEYILINLPYRTLASDRAIQRIAIPRAPPAANAIAS